MNVFKDLKNYKGLILIVFLLTLGNTVGELLLPFLMSMIVDNGVANENITYIVQTGLVMLGVAFLTFIVRGSAAYYSAKASMAFSRDLRKRLFNKVNHMTFDETESFGISSLITRTTNDVAKIEQLVLMGLRPLTRAPLTFIGGLVMALITDVRLTLIILLTLPILAGMLYYVIKVIIPYFPVLQRALDRINLLLRQRLSGLKVIRAFSRDEEEEAAFEEANQTYYETGNRVNKIMQTVNPLLVLTLNLGIVAVLLVGSQFIDTGTLQIGELMAFVQYITQVLSSVIIITRMMTTFPRAAASINRVQEVVEYPSRKVGGERPLDDPITNIEANQLTFNYPNAKKPALSKIDFSVKAGETLGIIGGTGSGKSTLLKLFLQFYEPTAGELLINGQPIEELNTEDLREAISYVPQQNYFFSESVRGNLSFSNRSASDERMLDSLDTAQAMQFLPENQPLDQRITRGGGNFSGGQKQRLAISRALNRVASVYIFDDSFSALDYRTDYNLRKSLDQKFDQAITILVAQRVATIRNADKILVLENGEVQGYGTHDELVQDNDVYKEIVVSQGEKEEGDNESTSNYSNTQPLGDA